jgi:hypothetical protein
VAPRHKAAKPRLIGRRRLTARSIAVPTGIALAATSVVGVSLIDFGGSDDHPTAHTVAPTLDEPMIVPDPPRQDRDVPASRSAARTPLAADRSARQAPPTAESSARTRSRAEDRATPRRQPVEPPSAPKPEPEPVSRAQITDRLFLSAALNVWSGPGEKHTLLDVLPAGTRVPVTGDVVRGQWAEISYERLSRWVNADYLVETRPEPPAPSAKKTDKPDGSQPQAAEADASGFSSSPCPTGSAVESGLMANAVAVHRAVCAAFPSVSSYGGLRPGDDGAHGQGLGLDIMVTGSTGDQIAQFVQSNSGALGVSEVIWSQRIWTVERSSEGWRWLEDRGSVTANHYDHVHVTVYG